MIIAVIGLIIISGLFLFSIAPNKNRREQMKIFEQQYIAHRGLFDNQNGIPENSIPAFQKAVDMGYGIELDVQLTTDNKLVVFHDESLLNITFVKNKNKPSSYWRVNKKRLFNLKIFIPLRNIYSFMHFKYGICISVTYRDVSLVKPASISVISTESPQQAYPIWSI